MSLFYYALTSHFSLERVRMCEFARLKCEVIALSLYLCVCVCVCMCLLIGFSTCVHACIQTSINPSSMPFFSLQSRLNFFKRDLEVNSRIACPSSALKPVKLGWSCKAYYCSLAVKHQQRKWCFPLMMPAQPAPGECHYYNSPRVKLFNLDSCINLAARNLTRWIFYFTTGLHGAFR